MTPRNQHPAADPRDQFQSQRQSWLISKWQALSTRYPRGAGYIFAIGATVLALFLRWTLDPFVGDLAHYSFFYPAVAAAALAAGWRVGSTVMLVGAISAFWLFVWRAGRFSSVSYMHIAVYLLTSLVLVGLAEWGRRQRARAVAREDALRRSEERLRLAQVSARIGIWDWNPQTNEYSFTPELNQVYGLEPGTIKTYADWRSRVHPEDIQRVEQQRARAIGLRQPFSLEFRFIHSSGEIRWLGTKGGAIYSDSGQVVRVLGVNIDITERKQAEEAVRLLNAELERRVADQTSEIRRTYDLLAGIMTGTADPIATIDTDLRYTTFNRAYRDAIEKLYGVRVEVGMRMADALAHVPEDSERLIEFWRGALRGHNFSVEGEFGDPARQRNFYELHFSPVRDAADRIVGAAHIARDVTVHRQAEEAVRAERQRLYDVLETLPVYVVLLTQDHYVPFANRFFRERFGESGGRRCYEYLFGRTEACENCESFVPFTTKSPHRWEWTGPDGRNYDISDFPFTDSDGSPFVMEMGIDITERKQAERQLMAANEQLRARAAQLRALAGELTIAEQRERRRIARVMHDHLQQLLVGAKFRVSLLGRASDELVHKGVSEIEELLSESIAASRSLTAELSPPILHEGGLAPGLEWLARWMSDHHGLSVELALEAEVPQPAEDVKVILFEAVRELLFNAVKHAQVSSAKVSLQQISRSELQVIVSDSGAGFDPSDLRPAGAAGGGFGLFSIRERLELIGGQMDIDSSPGQGTRVAMTVAIDEEQPEAVSPVKPEVAVTAEMLHRARPEGTKIRVLIADDHTVMRDGLAQLIGQEPDMEVAGQASDGQGAIELARALRPDVIVMDLSMPRVNGADATRAILKEQPHVKVIGLSMFEEAERAQMMRAAGVVAYLTKSGPSESVLRAIRACLGQRTPQARAETSEVANQRAASVAGGSES